MRGPEQGHCSLGASPATIKPSPCLAPAGLRWKITVSHCQYQSPGGVSGGENRALATFTLLPNKPHLGEAVFPVGARSGMWVGSVRYCKLMTRLPTEPSSAGPLQLERRWYLSQVFTYFAPWFSGSFTSDNVPLFMDSSPIIAGQKKAVEAQKANPPPTTLSNSDLAADFQAQKGPTTVLPTTSGLYSSSCAPFVLSLI